MTTSADVLQKAIARLKAAFKAKGFSSRGTTLIRTRASGNTSLLQVQKSRDSDARVAKLTLNYGVHSRRISDALRDEPKKATDIWSAHWLERLSSQGQELWLYVGADEMVDVVADRLLQAAAAVEPDFEAHAEDEALRDDWLRGHCPGIGEMQRLMYLAILLHGIGPRERLPAVLAELDQLLDGKPQARMVSGWLVAAGVRPPG